MVQRGTLGIQIGRGGLSITSMRRHRDTISRVRRVSAAIRFGGGCKPLSAALSICRVLKIARMGSRGGSRGHMSSRGSKFFNLSANASNDTIQFCNTREDVALGHLSWILCGGRGYGACKAISGRRVSGSGRPAGLPDSNPITTDTNGGIVKITMSIHCCTIGLGKQSSTAHLLRFGRIERWQVTDIASTFLKLEVRVKYGYWLVGALGRDIEDHFHASALPRLDGLFHTFGWRSSLRLWTHR